MAQQATEPVMTGPARPVIRVARVYDPPEDGARILVDRLWPRGLSKATLRLDDWPKELTPSDALRRWFHADRSRWPEFRRRYLEDLAAQPVAVARCLDWCRKGPVTLLTAAQGAETHATVLRDLLLDQLEKDRP